MVLLDSFAGTFPDYVSAGVAIATLILALITYLQNKKIQELVDITIAVKEQTEELSKQTGELSKQTEIAKGRFDLENELALLRSIAFFNIQSVNDQEGYPMPVGSQIQHVVVLINLGNTAYNLLLRPYDDPRFEIGAYERKNILKDETIRITIVVDTNIPRDVQNKPYVIEILSFNNRGQIIKQTLRYKDEDVNHELSEPLIVK